MSAHNTTPAFSSGSSPARMPAPAPAPTPVVLPGLNMVVICPSLSLRDALIRAIQETSKTEKRPDGIVPTQRSDSESARRAHYPPAISQIIINTASQRMHDVLGRHAVAVAVIVEDRIAAAHRARKIFEGAGFEADVYTHAEPEFPDGFLTFVSVEELEGIVLMFWPDRAAVTPELLAQLPAREPWSFDPLPQTVT